jgi:hypothetical protein
MNCAQSARRRCAGAMVTVAAVLVLSACGGASSAHPSSTASAAVSPSTWSTINQSQVPVSISVSVPVVSPTPSTPTPISTAVPTDVPTTGPNLTKAGEAPPIMPLAATLHSAPGGVAFAKFFIQTMDWAFASTNGSYMRKYYQYSCTTCRSVADGVDRSRAAGIHYIGDRSTNISGVAESADPTRVSDLRVKVTFNVTAGESVGEDGKPVHAEPPQHGFIEMVYLAWVDNRWTVTDMVPNQ